MENNQQPQQPTPQVQPESIHPVQRRNWPVIAAAVGVPLLVMMIAGLLLLPKPPDADGGEGGTNLLDRFRSGASEIEVGGDNGDEESVANPAEPVPYMKLMTVEDAVERGAVCNDGSPAKYYFRPGTEEFKDKWIIWFEGGGACRNAEHCLARAESDPKLVSSRGLPATLREGGFFSTNPEKNEDFYGWNHVMLNYCSSDSWIGDSEQIVGDETWYFHGKTIPMAVLEDLKNPDLMETATLTDATEVIVSGSSAGGTGASQNIDDIALALKGAVVKGVIDSSWSALTEPYVKGEEYDDVMRSDAIDFQNKQFDDTCVAANPDDLEACSSVAGIYPYLETPVFIFINQYDNYKLDNMGVKAPIDEGERAWLEEIYVPELLASLEVVEATDGLFSPADTFHTLLTREQYYTTDIGDVTFDEAFTNWYFDRPGETHIIEE